MIDPVIIIGAGVSGLMAQSVLKRNGIRSLILEKSRGLGGRCATRRGEYFIADHGPQYFNARILNSKMFHPDSNQKLKTLSLDLTTSHPRLIHPDGISQMARMISDAPEVVTNERVSRINFSEDNLTSGHYRLECESGQVFLAKNILLTAPVPQSVMLFKDIMIAPDRLDAFHELSKIQYDSCIALILELSHEIRLGQSGIWKDCSAQISGIYNQREKGIETITPTLVIHASPKLSQDFWEAEALETEKTVLFEAEKCLNSRSIQITVKHTHLHRWKYSEPKTLYPKPYALLGRPGNECVLAGDSFLRSSLGGAIASGEAAALALIQQNSLRS